MFACTVLGIEPTAGNALRVATIIHEGLPDLIRMPGPPLSPLGAALGDPRCTPSHRAASHGHGAADGHRDTSLPERYQSAAGLAKVEEQCNGCPIARHVPATMACHAHSLRAPCRAQSLPHREGGALDGDDGVDDAASKVSAPSAGCASGRTGSRQRTAAASLTRFPQRSSCVKEARGDN